MRLTLEHLARTAPSWGDQWRLLDATPVLCGASRETVRRSDLAGWAGYGYDRSHPRWYWGLKLYLLAAPDGMPVAWVLPPPSWASARSRPRCWGWPATRGCCARGWSSPPIRAWPAEHAAESLAKGSRVVVVGRLQQRSWTAEDGSARSVVEVVAEELGLSLRWATATTTRATRSPEH